MESTAKTINLFREAIQDLLVPELRSLKVSLDAIRREMQLRGEEQAKATQALDERQTLAIQALSEKTKQSVEALDSGKPWRHKHGRAADKGTQELGHQLTRAIESLIQEISRRDAHQTENMEKLSPRLNVSMDIRERLAQVEALLPKQ